MLVAVQACAGVEQDPTEWMRLLPDALPVCKMSIPGTHDSGATLGGAMLQTQSSDIGAQLQQGIRAFDIRLQATDGRLGVYHSVAFQALYWEDDVLPAFVGFLESHPSEGLIVSLKKEGGGSDEYAALLSASLSAPTIGGHTVTDFNPGLTLGELRGKMLFLHRDSVGDEYVGTECHGWVDNATCLLTLRGRDGTEATALLEDEYQYPSAAEACVKVEACTSNLDRIASEPADSCRWGLTYVSATALPAATPKAFADIVNGAVADYVGSQDGRTCGIVFMDFAAEPDGRRLVGNLIGNNTFRYKPLIPNN